MVPRDKHAVSSSFDMRTNCGDSRIASSFVVDEIAHSEGWGFVAATDEGVSLFNTPTRLDISEATAYWRALGDAIVAHTEYKETGRWTL